MSRLSRPSTAEIASCANASSSGTPSRIPDVRCAATPRTKSATPPTIGIEKPDDFLRQLPQDRSRAGRLTRDLGRPGAGHAQEAPLEARDNDHPRRHHRREPLRRLRQRDPLCRPGSNPLLSHRRPPRFPCDAHARRNGRGSPDHRFVHGVRPCRPRQLGRLPRRLALLVFLGRCTRLRGRARW